MGNPTLGFSPLPRSVSAQVISVAQTPLGTFQQVTTCPKCAGAGEESTPCNTCGGDGRVRKTKGVTLKVSLRCSAGKPSLPLLSCPCLFS